MRVIGVYQESVLPEGLERVGIGFRLDVLNVLGDGSSPGRESDDTVLGMDHSPSCKSPPVFNRARMLTTQSLVTSANMN